MPKKRETTSAQAGPVSTLYIDLSILNSCKGLPSNCNRLSWEYLLFTGNWIKGCKKRNLSLYIEFIQSLSTRRQKEIDWGFLHSLTQKCQSLSKQRTETTRALFSLPFPQLFCFHLILDRAGLKENGLDRIEMKDCCSFSIFLLAWSCLKTGSKTLRI